MPNYFTLTRKGESKPASLQGIDDDMRIEFGEEPDEESWLWGWYDTVGLGFALGRDWDQLRAHFGPKEGDDDDEFGRQMLNVIDWLEANYTLNAWAERGRG